MTDELAALERHGDELEKFADCDRQVTTWLREHSSDELVEDLRQARREMRRVRLGTINTLILLHHIDRLEAEIAKAPLRLE